MRSVKEGLGVNAPVVVSKVPPLSLKLMRLVSMKIEWPGVISYLAPRLN